MKIRGISTALVAACAVLCACACGNKDEGATDPTPATPVAQPAQPARPPAPEARPEAREPKPGEATARRESYGKALARGRKLIADGEAAGAVKAFEAALAARPNSAVAHSELSWAAFKTGDHEAAIDAASKSIERATNDPSLRAASLYNRGRAKEAGKDKDGAIADYQASYELRPHKAVRARLEALKARVPESVWTAAVLEGPFAQLSDFCGKTEGCPEGAYDVEDLDASKIPWASKVQAARLEDMPDGDYFEVALLFQTDKGWYALRRFERYINRYEWGIDSATVIRGRLAIVHENSDGRFETDHQRVVTVCGVGDSGRPSCFGPSILGEWFIGYEGTKEDGKNLPPEVDFKCSARLAAGDRLEITAEDKACRQRVGFVGEHKLVFP